MIPSDFFYVSVMGDHWDQTNKYKTLTAELGFNLDNYAANGWTRPFFDDFTGTAVGQQPANIRKETLPKVGSANEQWWSYGRGPTGSALPIEPGANAATGVATNQYQILAPSVLGIGAYRVLNSDGTGGNIYSGSMQTQRRSATKVVVENPSNWDPAVNLAYSQSYGYFESSMKAPRYPGSWPGAWMVSDDEYSAPMYPRVELDINEIYLSGAVGSAEDGIVHNTPWLHRPQGAARIAPGWCQFDRGWSANSNNLDQDMRYSQGAGALKQWDDGFHKFGVFLKQDLTAPNGLGWWIWYVDREEVARIPLINEWLRYYYLIISHQTQGTFHLGMVPGQQYWLEVDYWGAWRNPAITDPPRVTQYIPPVLTVPAKTISIPRLERHMSVKADTKVNGFILPPEHSNPNTPPIMDPEVRFIQVEGRTAGYIIGTVAVSNVPSFPVKYRLTGTDSDHFVLNESTGQISVATGVTLAINNYDLVVSAWSFPLVPCIQGTNCTHVLIDVREDALFSFAYWTRVNTPFPRGDAVPKLRGWIDAQDSTNYTLGSGNTVSQIVDKSVQLQTWDQPDVTKRCILNATGIGGHPAFESQNNLVSMPGGQLITPSAFQNIILRTSGQLSVGANGGTTPTGTYDFVNPFILFMAWTADPATNPDNILCSYNGTIVNAVFNGTANKTYTMAVACVCKADGTVPSGLGRIYDSSSGFFSIGSTSTTTWFDGKIGEFGIVYWADNEGITPELHQKLVGGLAHKWSLTSLLPAAHPYKVLSPRMWEETQLQTVSVSVTGRFATAAIGIVSVSTTTSAPGDPNRWMFAGGRLKPYNKKYTVTSGLEFALTRWPVTAPAYGAINPRVGYSNWYMSETGTAPVEVANPTQRVILGAKALFRGVYYTMTFNSMSGKTGCTITNGGLGVNIASGLNAIADALPFTMDGHEMLFVETHEQQAIGDGRAGGRAVISYLGESCEYSSTTLAAKFGNNTILNDGQPGSGGFVCGPVCMFAKGWDATPVVLDMGHNIHRGSGAVDYSLRGMNSAVERGYDALQLPFWNRSVSGFAMGTMVDATLTGGAGRSKAMFDLLDNPAGAMPFTVMVYPGDINDRTITLPTWQSRHTTAWATARSLFPGVRLVQELCPPYSATTDPNYKWTDQTHQGPSASPATSVWVDDGFREQLNDWILTQVGGTGPDAVLNLNNKYSEQADFTLTRTTLTGATFPKMADALVHTANTAGSSFLLVDTTQRPTIGAGLVAGVGTVGAEEEYVKTAIWRPDQSATTWQITPGTPTTTSNWGSIHAVGESVMEEMTTDGLNYTTNFYRYLALQGIVAASSAFGTMPALVTARQAETQLWFDRFQTTMPSAAHLAAMDDFIVAAKLCGFWDVCDAIYDLTSLELNSIHNMKSSSYKLVKTGGVTFSVGATGDGTTGYLDTQFNPATAAGLFAQNSAHMGVFCLSNITEDRSEMGNSANALDCRRTSTNQGGRLNSSAIATVFSAPPTSHGHALVYRSASTSFSGRKNGSTGTSVTANSVALTSANLRILNGATGFSTKKVGLAHFGSGDVTANMAAAMFRASNALMQAKGAF